MYSVNSFENEVYSKLSKNKNLYDPFVITKVSQEHTTNSSLNIKKADTIISLKYLEQELSLIVEIKNRTVPQIVERGITTLKTLIKELDNKKYFPALIVPYLSEGVIDRLKSNKLSGLDLNGNYFITTTDFVAIRLEKKNQYKESTYIKDIYSRNSSLVGRFLLRNNYAYEMVSDIYDGIKTLGGNISLSTVSKVLKRLEEQLIISKENNKIRLLQPDKLLINLKDNYVAPSVQMPIKINLPDGIIQAKKILYDLLGTDWIWAGESSAGFYASDTPVNLFKVYSKTNNNPPLVEENVKMRFYNCSIFVIPTVDQFVFFDSSNNAASKIQSYLELSQLDKREKEIAHDIEKDILNEFRK